MIDNITPELWPAVLVLGFLAFVAWIVLEVRASNRFYANQDAADPVVVTGSGNRSNRYPRACGGVR